MLLGVVLRSLWRLRQLPTRRKPVLASKSSPAMPHGLWLECGHLRGPEPGAVSAKEYHISTQCRKLLPWLRRLPLTPRVLALLKWRVGIGCRLSVLLVGRRPIGSVGEQIAVAVLESILISISIIQLVFYRVLSLKWPLLRVGLFGLKSSRK